MTMKTTTEMNYWHMLEAVETCASYPLADAAKWNTLQEEPKIVFASSQRALPFQQTLTVHRHHLRRPGQMYGGQ